MIERQSVRSWLTVLVAVMLPATAAADDAEQSAMTPVGHPVPQSLLLRFLTDHSTFTLVDARSAEEYDESHIDGAVNVPHDGLDAHGDSLPASRDETIVVYCRTGKRAGQLKAQLVDLGYNDVRVLQPEQIFSSGNLMVFNCGASTPKSRAAQQTAATDAREEKRQ